MDPMDAGWWCGAPKPRAPNPLAGALISNTDGGRRDPDAPAFALFSPPPLCRPPLFWRFPDAFPLPFPPLAPFPLRRIHRTRSATSRTPFAGSSAAILMYLHRLVYRVSS
jgi:hypothetical protein